MNPENKTFCMAPWVHMNIAPNGDVYPCCLMPICDIEKDVSDNGIGESTLEAIASECNGTPRDFRMGSLMDESLKEIWNNENMRELRRNMMAGEKSSYCTACYKEEEIRKLRNTIFVYSHICPIDSF
mgnify:CR=1 FL=1